MIAATLKHVPAFRMRKGARVGVLKEVGRRAVLLHGTIARVDADGLGAWVRADNDPWPGSTYVGHRRLIAA